MKNSRQGENIEENKKERRKEKGKMRGQERKIKGGKPPKLVRTLDDRNGGGYFLSTCAAKMTPRLPGEGAPVTSELGLQAHL